MELKEHVCRCTPKNTSPTASVPYRWVSPSIKKGVTYSIETPECLSGLVSRALVPTVSCGASCIRHTGRSTSRPCSTDESVVCGQRCRRHTLVTSMGLFPPASSNPIDPICVSPKRSANSATRATRCALPSLSRHPLTSEPKSTSFRVHAPPSL